MTELKLSDWTSGYHGVLQQVLQFAQPAVLVAGVLSLYRLLKLPQVRLAVPGVAHVLEENAQTPDINNLQRKIQFKLVLSSLNQMVLSKLVLSSLNWFCPVLSGRKTGSIWFKLVLSS